MSVLRPSAHPLAPTSASTPTRSTGAIVAVACAGIFVSYLPTTIVSVSMGAIARSTGADAADLQWIMSLLVIPMAALILTFGLVGDLYGRKRVFMIGLALCAIGAAVSTAAGATESRAVHLLWAGQTISGAGAAALIPSTLAIISAAETDLHKRARLIGLWASCMVLALALGGYISAVTMSFTTWHWVFVILIPLSLIVMVLGAFFIEESYAKDGRALDFPGQILAIVSIVAIVDGVISGGSDGFSNPRSYVALIVGVCGLAAFAYTELRSRAPMMSLRLFANPEFAVSAVSAAVAMFAYIGLVYMLSIYFGSTQHLTAFMSADRYVVMFVACALGSQVAGPLMKRWGYRVVLVVGLLVLAAGLFSIVSIDYDAGFVAVAWRILIAGFGMGLVLPTVTAAAVNSVPHTQAGMASAAINAIRQFGGAMGPAVFGVVLISWAGSHVTSTLTKHNVPDSVATSVSHAVSADGVQRVGASAGTRFDGTAVPAALGDAQTSGLHVASLVGGVIFVLVAVICVTVFVADRLRRNHRTSPEHAQ